MLVWLAAILGSSSKIGPFFKTNTSKDSLKAESSLSSGSAVSSKKESKRITFNAAGDNDEYTTTAEAASIETKRDAEALIATINADNTIGEAEKNAALAQVQEFVKTLDVFDFAKFLDKTRIQNSGDATGAILTIQNNDNIPKDAKDDYIAQLTDVMDMYNHTAAVKTKATV